MVHILTNVSWEGNFMDSWVQVDDIWRGLLSVQIGCNSLKETGQLHRPHWDTEHKIYRHSRLTVMCNTNEVVLVNLWEHLAQKTIHSIACGSAAAFQ